MNLFDVYPLFDIAITKGEGCRIRDEQGNDYLDLYGGHAVISIGHSHPVYTAAIARQVQTLGFRREQVATTPCRTVGTRIGIR